MENARFRELMHTVWTKDFLVIVKPMPGPSEQGHRYSAQAYSLKDYTLDFKESGCSEMEALEAVARRLGLLPPLPPAASPAPGPEVRGGMERSKGGPYMPGDARQGIWAAPAACAA